jgi:hypothetical protein
MSLDQGEIIEISHRSVIPDNFYEIPEFQEFQWNFMQIFKEFQK